MFQKGEISNPTGENGSRDLAGRPSDRFRHLCQRAIEEDNQLDILRKTAKGIKTGTDEPKVKDQLHAIEITLERAYGKSDQTIHHDTTKLSPIDNEFLERIGEEGGEKDFGVEEGK